MALPLPLDPYVYRSRMGRVVDGDTVLQDISLGFGTWLLGSKWPGGPDAKYPQGRYRLHGINTPEIRGAEWERGLVARERVIELASSGEEPGILLTRTTKHGKFRFLIDLFVKQKLAEDDPFHKLDVEVERKTWLSDAGVAGLIEQTEQSGPGPSTVRALATEVLWSRRALQGFGKVVHVNQTLLDEGLAVPYFGGKK